MNKELFEEYPIPKAIGKLAMPTILGMLINIIYNMADTFFVAKTQDQNQVAAVTLCLPIFLLLMSFGNIFAIGGGAYVSRLLGEKNYEKIKNVTSFSFYFCIVTGIICTLTLILFIEPVLKFIGTSTNTYNFSKSYLIILSLGATFICLQTAFGGIIRAEGASKQAMIGMMIGTILNIVLDPIMILNMNMGITGAALATIIGNIASCVYYIYYLLFKKTCLSINIKYFSLQTNIIKNILIIGIPVSLNTILISAANIILNNFAAHYSDTVVTALGISGRVSTIAIMLLLGLSQGSQPFIGYNFAAKNYTRMNKAIKFSMACAIIIGTTSFLTTFIFAEQIVKIFLKEPPQVIEYGKYFIKATMSAYTILGVQFILMSTFQAMGKGGSALIVSLCRQGFAFVPAIIIGNMLFELNGIVWAQPFADIISVFIASIMYIIIQKNLKK
ncbi:MATE family efflux transporter [uncultured Tyzzerella sp.]|uniref:MATE family efflux transporter n=1 Tax=uncultured Tyzzerella sp. TaxID=2321398 RepID=UPI0029421816|nr:MATE family efflux transporter [uncultured Tyzzerella sp.]